MKLFLLQLGLLCLYTSAHKIVPRQITQLPQYTKLSSNQIRHLENQGFGPTVPSGFRPTSAYEEEEDEDLEEDTSVASTQVRRPTYSEENYPNPNSLQVLQQRPQARTPVVYKRPIQQQYRPQQVYQQEINEDAKLREEEEEKEEPDRLAILLPQSKFDCSGKKTGYYADEGLGCEVFHYCQENAKHSWICPEGFTFHQVHLICMPPGGDNICEKSSDYHFVNEFLYKPINLEEHQNKPNISLKYSDRYYPENYYSNHYNEDYQATRKQPIRIGLQQEAAPQPQVILRRPVTQAQFSPTFRPETTIGQVFRSPEEVNISLQQRRPQYVAQRYLQTNNQY